MQLSNNIKSRRSIRKYKEGAVVSDEQIKLLLEAAMLAPSACNTRPWEFIVVTNRDMLRKIAELHPHAKMLNTASASIIVCGLPGIQSGVSGGFFQQDCGAATQNIMLQACDLGLGSCWCGVYPKEYNISQLKELLSIPEASVPFSIVAIGEADESPNARGFYEQEKVRYIK